MALTVDIDGLSGFCKGVIRAISTAEKHLGEGNAVYSLGPIVHNDVELSRLGALGLRTIEHSGLRELTPEGHTELLIRAHGEPPETYRLLKEKGLEVIDCTCPVVLGLQKQIREAYGRVRPLGGQIVIFGKVGHAEVLGLVGQVGGDAIVVEDVASLEKAISEGRIATGAPIEVFSQTTKSPDEYAEVCCRLKGAVIHNTICAQVASRHKMLSDFANSHDVIIFVAGNSSSNGKVLCELCRSLNARTYHIQSPADLREEWFRDGDNVGVCGATSTPRWLLEEVADEIIKNNK